MTGKYTSPFDDLLASNQKQLDDVLGGASQAFTARPKIPTAAAPPAENSVDSDNPSVIKGTSNGIPFQLKV
jgi:hypothetical protein